MRLHSNLLDNFKDKKTKKKFIELPPFFRSIGIFFNKRGSFRDRYLQPTRRTFHFSWKSIIGKIATFLWIVWLELSFFIWNAILKIRHLSAAFREEFWRGPPRSESTHQFQRWDGDHTDTETPAEGSRRYTREKGYAGVGTKRRNPGIRMRDSCLKYGLW